MPGTGPTILGMSNPPKAPILRLSSALPVGHLVFFAGRDRTVLKVRYSPTQDRFLHILS